MTADVEVLERPIIFSTPMVEAILAGQKTQTRRVMRPQPVWREASDGRSDTSFGPYQVGDTLWVRETFANMALPGYDPIWTYKAGAPSTDVEGWMPPGVKWRPSIHMPRAAARLFLRVTRVRVERLQEMGPKDAIAEGVFSAPDRYHVDGVNPYPVASFSELWDSLNAKRGYGWSVNPWVYVIEFER